jgi:hypothetical protein
MALLREFGERTGTVHALSGLALNVIETDLIGVDAHGLSRADEKVLVG